MSCPTYSCNFNIPSGYWVHRRVHLGHALLPHFYLTVFHTWHIWCRSESTMWLQHLRKPDGIHFASFSPSTKLWLMQQSVRQECRVGRSRNLIGKYFYPGDDDYEKGNQLSDNLPSNLSFSGNGTYLERGCGKFLLNMFASFLILLLCLTMTYS